jgi:hypothetical protein
MSTNYRCKKCDTIVPRGYRMQSCECGKVEVDWGSSGGKGDCLYVRVLWPGGDHDEWVEVIPESPTQAPGQPKPDRVQS